MKAIKDQVSSKMAKAYARRDFVERYLKVYGFAQIIIPFCLAISAVSSYNFFKGYVFSFENETLNIVLSAILTVAMSAFIGVLSKSVRMDYFREQWDQGTSIMLVVTLAMMAGNVWMDYMGVPVLAEQLTRKPEAADSRTASTDKVYQAQMSDAKLLLEQKQARVVYLKTTCKTDDCWVQGGKAYWKGNLTKYGREAIRTAEAEATEQQENVAAVQAAWNNQREQLVKSHGTDTDRYWAKVDMRTGTFRWLVAVMLIIYILAQIFVGYYGSKVAEESGLTPTPSHQMRDPNAFAAPLNGYQSAHAHRTNNGAQGIGFVQGYQRGGTDSVPTHTDSVPGAKPIAPGSTIVLKGEGFPYVCTECGADYFSGRKINLHRGEHPFCGDSCRGAWHKKRKRGEVSPLHYPHLQLGLFD